MLKTAWGATKLAGMASIFTFSVGMFAAPAAAATLTWTGVGSTMATGATTSLSAVGQGATWAASFAPAAA